MLVLIVSGVCWTNKTCPSESGSDPRRAKTSSRRIRVYIALGDENYLVGRLWRHYRKGRKAASFECDEKWLKHLEHFALEPALALTAGSFHTLADRSQLGSIGDSAPDRWRRLLMRRAEAQWDTDGDLAIAKFPRRDDENNMVVWEAVALTLFASKL